MPGPFSKDNTPPRQPKRNTFDLSHVNCLTLGWGTLTPFLVEPVLPGDSCKLDLTFGIRAMPMAFPLHTQVRVDAHIFYVRNRNLYKDFPNFFGKTQNPNSLGMPYIPKEQLPRYLKTGSLGDYLGLPSTVVGSKVLHSFTSRTPVLSMNAASLSDILVLPDSVGTSSFLRAYYDNGSGKPGSAALSSMNCAFFSSYNWPTITLNPAGHSASLRVSLDSPELSDLRYALLSGNVFAYLLHSENVGSNARWIPVSYNPAKIEVYPELQNGFSFTVQGDMVDYPGDGPGLGLLLVSSVADDTPVEGFNVPFDLNQYDDTNLVDTSFFIFSDGITNIIDSSGVLDPSIPSLQSLPPISALRFRAYEQIYNAFYRDNRNNPYIVNGFFDPNRFLPSVEGGPDSYDYDLRRRNWEQDFMTSALPSPQQGTAPLVGVTSTGSATFKVGDTTHTVQLQTADDGDTVTGATFSNDTPNSVARSIINMASSGFSIADFRGVNAFTRWLEINARRGLKFKDQLLSHFGVNASYAELDMPEFIGGFTKFFDRYQVNQTSADSEGSPLGSYAGQMEAKGGTSHTVKHYFDEPGFIIGIVSVVPVPVYTQLINKDWFKMSNFDYYYPEFGHLGYQPVSYAEVSPFQAIQQGIDPSTTFGYQRAWYEYLGRVDEAHGNFRDYFRDFLIGRQFRGLPTLNPDFLTVSSDQLNKIFTVNEIDGEPVQPFLGEIRIRNIMKRPIPLHGIAKLE